MEIQKIPTWRTEPNAQYFTREELRCDGCEKFVRSVIHISSIHKKDIDGDSENLVCWDCLQEYLETFLSEYDNEFVLTRIIVDILFDDRGKTKKRVRSEMTFKLRFETMKRDNFTCVLCGNTAKESRLEIDHIIPVCRGGKNNMDNLRTTCFKCNRGKGGAYG